MGGNKCVPKVATTILLETLTQFVRKDFAPFKPKPEDHTKIVTTDDGTESTENDGGMQSTLEGMYQEELKIKAEEGIKYQQDMEKMYQVTLDQINNEMKAKLRGMDKSKDITKGKVCDQPHQAPTTSLLPIQPDRGTPPTTRQPPTNVLRSMSKLICTQQSGMDLASYYEIKENIKFAAKYSTYEDCQNTLCLLLKPIHKAIEQHFLATIIVEGCDKDTSSELKNTLANNYFLLNDQYPSTMATALNMLNAFKFTKHGKGETNSRANNSTNNGNNQSSNKTAAFATTRTKGNDFASDETNHRLPINDVGSVAPCGGKYYQFFHLAGVEFDAKEDKEESDDEDNLVSTLEPPALIEHTEPDNEDDWPVGTGSSIEYNDWPNGKTFTSGLIQWLCQTYQDLQKSNSSSRKENWRYVSHCAQTILKHLDKAQKAGAKLGGITHVTQSCHAQQNEHSSSCPEEGTRRTHEGTLLPERPGPNGMIPGFSPTADSQQEEKPNDSQPGRVEVTLEKGAKSVFVVSETCLTGLWYLGSRVTALWLNNNFEAPGCGLKDPLWTRLGAPTVSSPPS
eukprot:jgi/Psemu1/11556/gm1.11556_g